MKKMSKSSILLVTIFAVGFGIAGYQADKITGIMPSQEYSVTPDSHVVLFDAGSGSGVGKQILELSPMLKVTRFIDGDTVWIAYLPKTPVEEKLRLLQIDTPERGEPLYDEAGVALEKLINAAKTVYLEFPNQKMEKDKYGRLLCYLVTEDGKCLNVEVVRLGYSTYWTKYGRSEKYEEAFKVAEAEAKAKKLGIWGLSPEQFKKVDAPKKPEKKR